jgi:hypothetical protein
VSNYDIGGGVSDRELQSFQNLAKLAPTLNAASDELTKAIGSLEQSLKKLNIGVSAWVTFADLTDEPGRGEYDYQQVGYTKLKSEWGIALRRNSMNIAKTDRGHLPMQPVNCASKAWISYRNSSKS